MRTMTLIFKGASIFVIIFIASIIKKENVACSFDLEYDTVL